MIDSKFTIYVCASTGKKISKRKFWLMENMEGKTKKTQFGKKLEVNLVIGKESRTNF
jgi:hypothetical protein